MRHWLRFCVLVLIPALLAGCQHYQPAPLKPGETAAAFETRSLDDAGLKEFVEEFGQPTSASWPPAQWDFPTLTLVAFYFQPKLDVARAQWNLAKTGVKTAGGRPNPTLAVAPGYSLN